ncbi:hypothetical protein DNK56_32755 [Streptomyces sp. AC1-42W]|nr:hypothetical protein DNK56_32755 [Streptomyces sp. AC1-42W]
MEPCTYGRRRGRTRTARPCAICSWRTTSGTLPPAPRARRSCTTSAARTVWTGRPSSGWSPR